MLTHLLHQIGCNITIAHCNFCLRGKDSDADEQFVSTLASTIKVPIHISHFNTKQHAKKHKLSIQEAARNLRYQWFKELLETEKLDYIITAHNLNDSLETFLINLSRGTGLKGLTGIASKKDKIVRPLLAFSRKEIIKFAKENNYQWREDKSNADTKYTRNKIRHKVIPVLQELNPNLLETFKQTLKNLQGSEAIVKESVQTILKKIKNKSSISITFNVQDLKNIPNQKAYLHEIFAAYNFTNIEDIISLLSAQSGKQIFSNTHRLIKDRAYLLLVETRDKMQEARGKKQDVRDKTQEVEGIITDGKTKFQIQNLVLDVQYLTNNKQYRTNKNQVHLDKDLLKFPLTVRKWQKGDYFYPIGMRGKKKLSKYFKDEKLSLLEKENIWLLLSEEKIIWIIGKRQDERFKITKKTKEIVQITIN